MEAPGGTAEGRTHLSEENTEERSPEQQEQDFWTKEVERAEGHFRDWWVAGDKLMRLYRKQSSENSGKRKFAMLWANTEVLKPSIYAQAPNPQVSRRFKDKDPVGRTAAELLERACSFEVERRDLNSVLRHVRDDLLLPGRGQAWVRYEAQVDEAGNLVDEYACPEYLHRKQFIHGPARTWHEVPWVAKISFLSKGQGKKRFGNKWKDDFPTESQADSKGNRNSDDPNKGATGKVKVYEIWDKSTRQVIFFIKGAEGLLDKGPPPLNFDNFWPCPPPVFSTITNDSLIPVPDYKYYQDQAEEIDDLTQRISALTDALKLVGFYPLGAEGGVSQALEKAMDPSVENRLIGIPSWAAFSERGGGKAIEWLPVREVAETLRGCIEIRTQLIQDVYQITGLSDILRGSTNADETATAQSLKAQWGSVRIRERQKEMARFARDLIGLMCEIIAEHYDPQRIAQMANMVPEQPPMQAPAAPMQPGMPASPPDPAMVKYQQETAKLQAAFALLKDERLRGFRIDIETDSTIQPDEDAEKQRRVEFVSAVGDVFQKAIPTAQQVPETLPMLAETLLFVARGFRAGRTLEDTIEQAMDALKAEVEQAKNQPPPPNPETVKAEAQASIIKQKGDMELAHTQQKNQLELGFMQQKHDLEKSIAAEAAQQKLASNGMMSDQAMQLKERQTQAALVAKLAGKSTKGLDPEADAEENAALTAGFDKLGEGIAAMMQLIAQGQQQNAQLIAQSNQQVIAAVTAPKIVTTPDGRTYTSETATVN